MYSISSYRTIGVMAIAALLLLFAFQKGKESALKDVELTALEHQVQLAESNAIAANRTTELVTEYQERVKIIERRTREILQKTTVLKEADKDCKIPEDVPNLLNEASGLVNHGEDSQ